MRPLPTAKAAFYEEVLAWRGQRPRRPRGIDLTSMRTLLESAQRRFALLVLHYERTDPTTCGVGRVVRVTRTTCLLDWITPEATFEGEQRRYRLADLTRVQFGNDYEEALAAVWARRDAACITHLKRA